MILWTSQGDHAIPFLGGDAWGWGTGSTRLLPLSHASTHMFLSSVLPGGEREDGTRASTGPLSSPLPHSPAEGEGHEGFPPPPEKDLESPSSTHLEALVPSRDSRARTRSPSPRAWRPDFPGTGPPRQLSSFSRAFPAPLPWPGAGVCPLLGLLTDIWPRGRHPKCPPAVSPSSRPAHQGTRNR